MYCPNCGKENPEGTLYCSECGALLKVQNSETVTDVEEKTDKKFKKTAKKKKKTALGCGVAFVTVLILLIVIISTTDTTETKSDSDKTTISIEKKNINNDSKPKKEDTTKETTAKTKAKKTNNKKNPKSSDKPITLLSLTKVSKQITNFWVCPEHQAMCLV